MITMNVVTQKVLDDSSALFEKIFNKMTDCQDRTVRMLHDFERATKMESDKTEKNRK